MAAERNPVYPGTHALTHPDHPAIIMAASGETVTYRELDDRSNRLAQLWHDRGLRTGDHVAILLENRTEYYDAIWAALRTGLYFTTVNTHLTDAEIEYIVSDCGARSVVTSTAFADVVGGLDIEIPLMMGGDVEGWERYEDAVAAHPAAPLADQYTGAAMFYSSGTTGRPKGILFPLPDRRIDEEDPMFLASNERWKFGADTVYLSPAPLYHAAPAITCSMVHRHGGTTVILEKFDPEACLAAIERFGVTHGQFVPTMFIRMLKLSDEVRGRYDLSTMRLAAHAAAPCPVEVKRQMIDWWGPVILEYYAGSENCGHTMIDSHEWLAHPGSVGQPLGSTVHVCDDGGAELPVGEIGQIWFEAPYASFEYHNDPGKTAESRSTEGWFTMGDVGYVDDDGYLYLTDRQAFTIISGGVNIYPQEAEDVLVMHPSVADVAVIGVPDDELGEVVKAVVQPAEGVEAGDALAAELLAYCRSRLATYKCPRSVDFDPALPRLDTGKLYKRLLKDRYWGDRKSRIV